MADLLQMPTQQSSHALEKGVTYIKRRQLLIGTIKAQTRVCSKFRGEISAGFR